MCEETTPTDFSCQANCLQLVWVNGGLSRMCGNIQVRFLRGKGAARLPTYPTIYFSFSAELIICMKGFV
jgi:hypothetical protein